MEVLEKRGRERRDDLRSCRDLRDGLMQDNDEPTSLEKNHQLAYAGRCNGSVDGARSLC